MTKLKVDTWKRLNELAEALDVGDGITVRYVFRGHGNAAWKIASTLHRAATLDGQRPLPDAQSLLQLEGEATLRFRQAAASHVSSSFLVPLGANVDWWTLMRHYGAPSRLLDWTRSIFVAAYFACQSHPEHDGSIYLLDVQALRAAMEEEHGEDAARPFGDPETLSELNQASARHVVQLFDRQTGLPQRMVLQRGAFMLPWNVAADVEADLIAAVGLTGDAPKEHFRELLVPAGAKPLLMRRLRDTNITGATLFPDLDGVGRSLDEVLRWR